MPDAPGHDPGTRPRRVLIVDDNEAENIPLSRMLTLRGYEVEAVVDGASAMGRLARPEPPDVVLTDLRLPDLDGRDVARHAAGLHPRPIIALMTGWDYDQEPAGLEPWGIDFVFIKPLHIQDLLGRLADALAARGGGGR